MKNPRGFVGGRWEEIGRLQFDFLVGRGLKPSHRLLDIGCGCLRGGLHFIRYLKPDRYYGIDADITMIEAARLEIEKANLDEKSAHLLADRNFRFDWFACFNARYQQFDFMLAHSLFTHLPLYQIEACLASVARCLHPEGRFYASYFEPLANPDGIKMPMESVKRFGLRVYEQYPEEIEALCEPHRLKLESIGEYGHPLGQKMVEIRRG